MAAINFPSNPVNGQEYTNAGKTWVWVADVPAWEYVPASSPVAGLRLILDTRPTKAEILALGSSIVTRVFYAEDTGRLMTIDSGELGSTAREMPGAYTQSETEPSNPKDGDTWFQPSSEVTFVRYGGAWIGAPVSPAPSPGGAMSDLEIFYAWLKTSSSAAAAAIYRAMANPLGSTSAGVIGISAVKGSDTVVVRTTTGYARLEYADDSGWSSGGTGSPSSNIVLTPTANKSFQFCYLQSITSGSVVSGNITFIASQHLLYIPAPILSSHITYMSLNQAPIPYFDASGLTSVDEIDVSQSGITGLLDLSACAVLNKLPAAFCPRLTALKFSAGNFTGTGGYISAGSNSALVSVDGSGTFAGTAYGGYSSGGGIDLSNCALTTDAVWAMLNSFAVASSPQFIKLTGNPCNNGTGGLVAGATYDQADVQVLITAKNFALVLTGGALIP